MAFGGLIGKETQVDLSQYVTETELNSKGFATQSWVSGQGYATQSWINSQGFAKTSQIPSVPSGFGQVISLGELGDSGASFEADSSGTYLFYSADSPGTAIVFDLNELGSFKRAYYHYDIENSEKSILISFQHDSGNQYTLYSGGYVITNAYLYRIR